MVHLAEVVSHHMEPYDTAVGGRRGGGTGSLGLLVNRPGRTFARGDDGDVDVVHADVGGQQWIAKVLTNEQEAFERGRFERIRTRAGGHLVPEAVGTVHEDGTDTSMLVQVRSEGTAGDLIRTVDDAWFADDWDMWASFEAFLKLHGPRAARAATLSLFRDDAFAVEVASAEIGAEVRQSCALSITLEALAAGPLGREVEAIVDVLTSSCTAAPARCSVSPTRISPGLRMPHTT